MITNQDLILTAIILNISPLGWIFWSIIFDGIAQIVQASKSPQKLKKVEDKPTKE